MICIPITATFSAAAPMTRGKSVASAGTSALARGLLPTDPVGTFTLTLTNLVAGSAVQVETLAGAPVENRTAGSGTEVFTLSAYASGNPANNLRIKVRKGSAAPFYQPWETLATATPGSASIYVSQIPDE